MRKNQKSGDQSIQIAGNVQGSINTNGAVQIVIQQQVVQNQPLEAEQKTIKMTPQQVIDLLDTMTKDTRASVLEFAFKNMATGLLQDLDNRELYRIQRYAETVIARENR